MVARRAPLVALLLVAVAPSANAQEVRDIVRSYAPVRTRLPGWDGERSERSWRIENVVGFGTELPAGATPLAVREALLTSSFVISGVFEVFRGFATVWFRVPFTIGTFTPHWNIDSRHLFAFGNIEVEGGRVVPVRRDLALRVTVILACPTLLEKNAQTFGGYSGDAALTGRAASASRGFETPDLLEPGMASISPTLALMWRRGRLRLEPYGRLINFLDTSNAPEHRYQAQAVVGARASVHVARLELGARVWGRVPIAYTNDTVHIGAGAELRAHLTELDLSLGAIIPLYVAPGESRVYGVSLGIQFAL